MIDVINEVKSLLLKTSNYFNPTSNQGNNFWPSPVAQGLGQAQKTIQNFQRSPIGQSNAIGFGPLNYSPLKPTVTAIGQKLQQFPNTRVEFKPKFNPIGINNQYAPINLSGPITGMFGQQVRDYGNTMVKVGTDKPLDIWDLANMSDFVPGLGFIGAGTKMVEKKGAKTLLKIAESMPATERLRSLMNYENDLARLGYTASERAKIGVNEARTIINQNLPSRWQFNKKIIDESITRGVMNEEAVKGVRGAVNRVINPIKNLAEDLQGAIKQHDIDLKVAKVEGIKVARQFVKKVASDLEWKLVRYSQEPSLEVAKRLGLTPEAIQANTDLLASHRTYQDDLFRRAQEAGLEINYLKNHLYQLWKEGPVEVEKAIAKGLGKTPGFAKSRSIRTFEEGMKLDLTPKYTTFGQLNAESEMALHKAIANQKLADSLFNSRQILPSSYAPADWVEINASLFPKAKIRIGINQNIEQPYKAPKAVAEVLNQYFGGQTQSTASQALAKLATLSGKTQNIVLSGGVNTVNFYTLGQVLGDITMSIGDALSGHPVRALGTANASLKALIRGFVPGLSKGFEEAHLGTIKEMAEQGIGYGGIMDWKTSAKNVVAPEGKGVITTLFDEPTFGKFLWQKKVEMFENFRSNLISRGLTKEVAVKQAGKMLQTYDGAIEELGRNKDFENAIKTVFLAPKYRESLVNAMVNVGKGFTTKLTDPAYEMSRRLGLGMITTLFVYNEMNKKLNNGKNLWQNPAGKELELVIPKPTEENPNQYISIPWLPGKTAIFRRALGTLTGIIKGDAQEAVKQFTGLLSIPLSKGGELLSNKDYFGRDVIKDDTENYGPKPLQFGLWGAKSFSPGPVREGIQYTQDVLAYNKKLSLGKSAKAPSLGMAMARSAELPIKQGNFPNKYYASVDETKKKYDAQTVALYDQLHPKTAEFEVKEPKTIQEKILQNTIRSFNPNIYLLEREIAQKTAQKETKEVDPFYSYPVETAMRYVNYQRQNPGSQDGKDLLKAYPEIITLMEARSDYFDRNPISGQTSTSKAPQASKRAQALMDAKQWSDPEVRAYLDANRQYKNEQRELLGLTPLSAYQWNDYVKKVTLRKVGKSSFRVANIKLTTPKILKLKKSPTYKVSKTKKLTISTAKPKNYKFKMAKTPIKGLSAGIKLV